MSVPGRIGIILIIALALVDAIILISGARHAASAIETHAMAEAVPADLDAAGSPAARHEPLLSTALKQINLLRARQHDHATGI
jgi:hypothetical protein